VKRSRQPISECDKFTVSRHFRLAASPDERERLGCMAMREFRVLEGIDHPGILGQRDPQVTEERYNCAGSMNASKICAEITSSFLEK
jgi:hypothetical protein